MLKRWEYVICGGVIGRGGVGGGPNDLMPIIICRKGSVSYNTLLCNIFKYDRHPVTFELYLILTHEGSNVALKWEMYWEIYWETYLSDQTNTQTVISLKLRAKTSFCWQNGVDITWNNDQNVKLLMTGIR